LSSLLVAFYQDNVHILELTLNLIQGQFSIKQPIYSDFIGGRNDNLPPPGLSVPPTVFPRLVNLKSGARMMVNGPDMKTALRKFSNQ